MTETTIYKNTNMLYSAIAVSLCIAIQQTKINIYNITDHDDLKWNLHNNNTWYSPKVGAFVVQLQSVSSNKPENKK